MSETAMNERNPLDELSEVEAPANLTRDVALRIKDLPVPTRKRRRRGSELRPWLFLLTGGGGGLGAQLYGLAGKPGFNFLQPVLGSWSERVLSAFTLDIAAVVVAAALMIYIAGLFTLRRD